MLSCQKRFVSIGGRATRAGSGTAHSRTSIKQVSAIPTAPGTPGKVRDRAKSPLFVPMGRVTQPQLRLRSPAGTWRHIDTSFSDLQGITDLVITPHDAAGPSPAERGASEVAEQLLELCNTFFTERAIAKFGNKDLVLNSGPETDSITNYTLKRRQWFAIVRAFYHGRAALWEEADAAALPIPLLYQLVTELDAASSKRFTTPALWEDEPAESYEALPLAPLVRTLAAAMAAQPGHSLAESSPTRLIGCCSLAIRYNVLFATADASAAQTDSAAAVAGPSPAAMEADISQYLRAIGASAARAVGTKEALTKNSALAFVRVLVTLADTEGEGMHDADVAIRKAARFVTPPAASEGPEAEAAHRDALEALLRAITFSGAGSPFTNFDSKDLSLVIIFLGAIRRASPPSYFTKHIPTAMKRGDANPPSSEPSRAPLAQYVTLAVEMVKRMLNSHTERIVHDEEGYDGLRDYGANLRLAHPDIHPHLKLRSQHSEGRSRKPTDKRAIGRLLEAYAAFIRTGASNAAAATSSSSSSFDVASPAVSHRFSAVTRQLLEQKIIRDRNDDGATSFESALFTLRTAMEHYGPTARHPRVAEALAAIDGMLSVSRTEELSAEMAVRCLELCAACAYLPTNIALITGRLLKAPTPAKLMATGEEEGRGEAAPVACALASRAATALAAVGYPSVGTFHALVTMFLSHRPPTASAGSTDGSIDAAEEAAVALCFAAHSVLAPADATAVMERVWGAAAAPCRPDQLSPRASLQIAQLVAAAEGPQRQRAIVEAAEEGSGTGDGLDADADARLLAAVEAYLIRALPFTDDSATATVADVVAALSTCAALGVVCPAKLEAHLATARRLGGEAEGLDDGMSVLHCATALATVPPSLLLATAAGSAEAAHPIARIAEALAARTMTLLTAEANGLLANRINPSATASAAPALKRGKAPIAPISMAAETAPQRIAALHAALVVLSLGDDFTSPSVAAAASAAVRCVVAAMAALDEAEDVGAVADVAFEVGRAEGVLRQMGKWEEAERLFAEL